MRWEPVCELVGHPRRPGSHQWSICPRAELTFCWKSLRCKRSFSSDFCILPLDVALNVNEKMVFFMSIWQIFCQITCHRFCTFTILYLSINSTKYSFWRAFYSAHLHKIYEIYEIQYSFSVKLSFIAFAHLQYCTYALILAKISILTSIPSAHLHKLYIGKLHAQDSNLLQCNWALWRFRVQYHCIFLLHISAHCI